MISFVLIFAKYRPTFKSLSLLDSVRNLQQSSRHMSHRTLNVPTLPYKTLIYTWQFIIFDLFLLSHGIVLQESLTLIGRRSFQFL